MLGVVTERSFATFVELSKKSDSEFVLGPNVSLCHLCLAVACDSGSTFFRRNTISTSSRVFLFDALIFQNV